MRANLRFWLALGLLLVAGVIILRVKERSGVASAPVGEAAMAHPVSHEPHVPALLTTPSVLAAHLASKGQFSDSESKTNRARYQLSNVRDDIQTLARRDSAILMRNALIDTRSKVELPIPAHLRAGEDPGAYIVQMRGDKSALFRKMLTDAGAEIVAYIPNNAFLIKAAPALAENIRGRGVVASMLPYEPYFKIDSRLMKAAVEQQPLDNDVWLRVTLFPGADLEALRPLAREMGMTEDSPFGQQILIQPRSEVLPNIAQLPGVQIIEPWNPRVPANDLTRVRLGVAENTVTNGNYLGLMGSNIWLNLNDIGVDGTHTDLVGRVFYQGTNGSVDPDGHGTHVAATIIGAGKVTNVFDTLSDEIRTNSSRMGTNITIDLNDNTTTNVTLDGSVTNASMRGMAPLAKLFVLPIDFTPEVNQPVTDTYLIETAARTNYITLNRTNRTLISNNSWNYANTPEYDSQAARFDAATRDAIKGMSGEQPVLYVFAAGNYGFGESDGNGGEPGRIASPGSAKNVITVGALESPRGIAEGLTNITVLTEGTNSVTNTNTVEIFFDLTDSQDQVASFSSRGNVGIGTEGLYGRFKPDLVSPGAFILSAKSKDWNLTNDFNPAGGETISNIYSVMKRIDSVSSLYRYESGTSFSAPGVSGLLALIQEFFGDRVQPSMKRNLSPALMKALLINSAHSVNDHIYDYQVQNTINYQGWGLVNLQTLLKTNMLNTEEKDWNVQLIEQSPENALTTGDAYTWDVTLNSNAVSGNLRVSLVWTDPPGDPSAAIKLVNDLDLVVEAHTFIYHGNDFIGGSTTTEPRDDTVFGDSQHRDFVNNVENVFIPGSSDTNDTSITIRVLGRRVNVRGLNNYLVETGDSNEIAQDFALVISSDYQGADTNNAAQPPFVSVKRRTTKDLFNARNLGVMTNGVPLLAQRVGANSPYYTDRTDPITGDVLKGTNGFREQWNFYVFTNNNANVNNQNFSVPGKYVAFLTFAPPELSIPRNIEGDLDLYVSKNPALTNLEPSAVASAWKSVSRGGTEQVVFQPDNIIRHRDGADTGETVPVYDPNNPLAGGVITNVANVGDVFYVGVKSEDQQGAEFSLIGVSSDQPFQQEENGKQILTAVPISVFIPDGLPNSPQAGIAVAIGLSDHRTLDASVVATISHQEFGDLFGTIRHNSISAVLNNHSLNNGNFSGVNSYIFSDNPYADRISPLDQREFPTSLFPGISPESYLYSDGPGILSGYAGQRMAGSWVFEMIDNAATHTGRVERLEVHIEPVRQNLLPGEITRGTVAARGQDFYLFDAPPDALKMTVILKQLNNLGTPLQLLVRKDFVPTTNSGEFDYQAVITPPADTTKITIDKTTFPPLSAGEYFIGVLNPGGTPTDYEISVLLEIDSSGANTKRLSDKNFDVPDDLTTNHVVTITNDVTVANAAVAILAENIPIADLVLHLVSPQGTRIVLSENRGGASFSEDFGSTAVTMNSNGVTFAGPSYAIFTDDPVAGLPIKFVPPPFSDSSTNRGVVVGNGFEGAAQGDYNAPQVFDGWKVVAGRVSVVTRPDANSGTNFLSLGNGVISRQVATTPGRSYKLSFAYRAPATNSVFNTGLAEDHSLQPQQAVELHYRLSQNPDPNFAGSDLFVAATNQPPFPLWFPNTTNSQWISLSPQNDGGHPGGIYIFETSFVINDAATAQAGGKVRFAGAPFVGNARFNGNIVSTPGAGSGPFQADWPVTLKAGLNTASFEVGQGPTPPGGLSIGFRAEIDLNAPAAAEDAIGSLRLTGGESNNLMTLVGSAQWKTFTKEFIASTNLITVAFVGQTPTGLEIDSVLLEDTGTVFLQPEEPLAILDGERAMGDWKLEAWDNSTGLSTTIKEWQLILIPGTAVLPAEKLANLRIFPTTINSPAVKAGTNYFTPGTIRRTEVQWFYYDVCPTATYATVRLFPSAILSSNNVASRIELLANRSGFPTGDPTRDDYVVMGTSSNNILTVTFTNAPSAAPLQPGKRMFFAVRNNAFFRTNIFRISITSDGNCLFVPPPALPLNQPVQSAAAPATDPNSSPDDFSFAAAGPSSVDINVQSSGGAVTIFASTAGDPTPSDYMAKQTVSTGTAALALPSAGNWKIRVYNTSSSMVEYSLTARGPAGFAILDTHIASGHFQVTWQSSTGTTYEIAVSTDLNTWNPIGNVTASGGETTYVDPQATAGTKRFYRIRPL